MNDIATGLKDIKSAFSQTNSRFLPFLKKHWAEIVGFTLGCLFLEQFFRTLSIHAQNLGHVNYGAEAGKALTGLFLLVIFSIQIPLRSMQDDGELEPMSFWRFSQKHSKAYALEGLVALGLILLGAIAFVIPALIIQVAITFFPFVIFCDPRYYNSDLNALKESYRLMKGLIILGTIFGVISLAAQLWILQTTERILVYETPVQWVLYAIGVILSSVYICLLLYRLYRVRIVSLAEQDSPTGSSP